MQGLGSVLGCEVWVGRASIGLATHSSILAWEIPRTEEPGRLQSMESQRVRHDSVTKQQPQMGVYMPSGPQDSLLQCSPAQSSSEGCDPSRAIPGRMVTQLGLEVGPCPKAVHTQSSRCSVRQPNGAKPVS